MNDTFFVRTRADAVPVIAALGRILRPGTSGVAAFDQDGEFTLVVEVEHDESVTTTVELLASIALPGEHVLVVSNRTHQVPADRPDDELVWEEMVGIARANEIVLWDWWVVWGTKAFSLAEFAPSPAGWPPLDEVRSAAG